MKKAEEEYAEAKKEYDTILLEMRDPDFKLEYGIEKVHSTTNNPTRSPLMTMYNRFSHFA